MEDSNVLKSMVCCDADKVIGLCTASIAEIEEERKRQSEKKILDFMNRRNIAAEKRSRSVIGRILPIKKLQTIEDARKEMDRLYEKTYNHEWGYGDYSYSYSSSYAWRELGEIRKIIASCRMAADGKIYLSQEGVEILSRDYSE